MRLTGSVPVLGCNDLEACLAFYQAALQFVIINKRQSEQGIEWVYLASGGCFLMLENRAESDRDSRAPSRLYLYTDDVRQLHHYLQARGYAPGALSVTDYGMQEFDILDPEGHRLSIGEKA